MPEAEFQRWTSLGFSHVWLMGVWTTSAGPAANAQQNLQLKQTCKFLLRDCTKDDIAASPYAIASYVVAEDYGGDEGLARFRSRLHDHGIGLILDFVPNHLALDHAWIFEHPDFFVHAPEHRPGTFHVHTNQGPRWFAHGKDPYFPPWTDTVQIDYRVPGSREAMRSLLGSIASRCDGVRCDMAMLALNHVFAETWDQFPVLVHEHREEFWSSAISGVRQKHPRFLFLAEAYWNLETRLIDLGFDYVYDKMVYDRIVAGDFPGLRRHLHALAPGVLSRGAHFLENHDEPRIASLLQTPEHACAALLIMCLPGMRLLHDGQLTGALKHVPVQFTRRPPEEIDPVIRDLYNRLLEAVRCSHAGHGTFSFLESKPTEAAENAEPPFLLKWTTAAGEFDLAAINFSSSPAHAALSDLYCINGYGIGEQAEPEKEALLRSGVPSEWPFPESLFSEPPSSPGFRIEASGPVLVLPPKSAHLLRYRV